jgi:hypothetical protein
MIKTLIVIACLVVGLLLMWAAQAYSQNSPCGKSAEMTNALLQTYGESVVLSGKTKQGNVLKIFVNPKTRTWTAAIDGGALLCLVASGGGATMGLEAKGREL